MFWGLIPPIFRSIRLCVTACGIMNPRCCQLPGYRPATSWLHYTTSCNTQSSAPEDGRDQRPKHVELIGIINQPLILHLVGVFFVTYINDARSNKDQTKTLPCFEAFNSVHSVIPFTMWCGLLSCLDIAVRFSAAIFLCISLILLIRFTCCCHLICILVISEEDCNLWISVDETEEDPQNIYNHLTNYIMS